jgi:hypothetical protein
MAPDTSSSCSNEQRTTGRPRSSAPSASSQRTPWVVPNPTTESRTRLTSVSLASGSPSPPQPASATTKSAKTTLRFPRMRAFIVLVVLGVTLAIVPTSGSATTQTTPDFWTGTWPAFLMEGGKITDPLGTLKWRQIRHEDGVALIGRNFGGKLFEGCSTDPSTLFFRGSYVEGGDLVACTTGADGKTIVGRFNGREDFMSGSFSVSIIRDDDKRVFAGKYFEDQGITTDWCGSLESLAPPVPTTPKPVLDVSPPRVTALSWTGPIGAAVPLRAKVVDNLRGAVTVTFTVKRTIRLVKSATIRARADGSVARATWRPPAGVGGTLSVCAQATDAAGNESARSCAFIRIG